MLNELVVCACGCGREIEATGELGSYWCGVQVVGGRSRKRPIDWQALEVELESYYAGRLKEKEYDKERIY